MTDTAPRAQLGKRLQAARKAAGLTQQQAADRVGMGRVALVLIENGNQRIDALKLGALAILYGVSTDSLLSVPAPVPAVIPTAVAVHRVGWVLYE